MPDALLAESRSLFVRLKAETAEQHHALEAEVNPLLRFQDREVYADYLRRALDFYRAMECHLGAFDWASLGLDFEARRKVPWLEQDLRALGVAIQSHSPQGDMAFSSLSAAIGGMYVLEGATLGGQMISRHLVTLGITPAAGGAFFHGYGERTGAMWKSFREAASRGCVSEPEVDEAVAAARLTFEEFAQWVPAGRPA